jgi:hypothetical protein
MRVCLSVTSLGFLEGGGHRWAYLNCALGLKSIGCEVTWLEEVADRIPDEGIPQRRSTNLMACPIALTG